VASALFEEEERRSFGSERKRSILVNTSAAALIFAALLVWLGFEIAEDYARHRALIAQDRAEFRRRAEREEKCRDKEGVWGPLICKMELEIELGKNH
jgi:cell division protein FtsB